MPKSNKLKIISIFTLAVLMSLNPLSLNAEESGYGEDYINTRIEEDIQEVDDIEYLDDTLDPRLDGSSMGSSFRAVGAPILDSEYHEQEVFAAISGGPFVGQLTKVPRSTATTVNIYSNANLSSRITYLENGMNSGVFPLLEESTNSYKIAISGVIGWVDKKYVDRFHYGNTLNGYDYYQVSNGRLYHYIGAGVNSGRKSAGLDQGPAPSYLNNGEYISYDGHYFYPCTVLGLDKLIIDYNSNTRTNSVNSNAPFYNYFMWLPARTQTKLTEHDFRNFLVSRGYNTPAKSRLFETEALFINNGDRYAGNAALAFSTAIHESAWGTSKFARQRNNYFGHAAYDSAPGMASAYLDPDEGIAFHFGTYWSWRYLYPNGRNNGGSLGNKGVGMNVDYASDPYWGEKIAAHYFNLDRASGNKDYGRYTIGVFNASGVNVRKDPNVNSTSIYKSTVSGMPIAILEDRNGWYGFTSDLIIDANKNQPPVKPWTPMKFSTSTVYTSKDFVSIVHKGSDSKLLTQKDVPFPNKPTVDKTSRSYTLKQGVSLRPNASTIYTPILTIPANTTINGYQTNNGWVQVLYNGNIGFISLSEINGSTTPPVNPPVNPPVKLPQPGNIKMRTTARVNIRTAPVTGTVVTTVPLHGEVTIGESVDGWVYAQYGKYKGYMSDEYFEKIPSVTPPETKPPVKPPVNNTQKLGDINGDGKIDAVDMAMMQAHVRNIKKLNTEQFKAADINKDGKIDAVDMAIIQAHVRNIKKIEGW